jgi:hypothetical protein
LQSAEKLTGRFEGTDACEQAGEVAQRDDEVGDVSLAAPLVDDPREGVQRTLGFAAPSVHGRRGHARHAAKKPVADLLGQARRLVECVQRLLRINLRQRFALGIQDPGPIRWSELFMRQPVEDQQRGVGSTRTPNECSPSPGENSVMSRPGEPCPPRSPPVASTTT